jgi:hypothetical protein
VTPRADRVVLGIEIALGIVPVTIIGGLLAVFGAYVGSASLAIMAIQHAWSGAALWLSILALAIGGLAGIVGLWATVLVTISSPPPDRRFVRTAIAGCAIGVVTAVAAVLLLLRSPTGGAPRFIVMLAAATVVVVHRLPAIIRRSKQC